jgi:hypothetical protein
MPGHITSMPSLDALSMYAEPVGSKESTGRKRTKSVASSRTVAWYSTVGGHTADHDTSMKNLPPIPTSPHIRTPGSSSNLEIWRSIEVEKRSEGPTGEALLNKASDMIGESRLQVVLEGITEYL